MYSLKGKTHPPGRSQLIGEQAMTEDTSEANEHAVAELYGYSYRGRSYELQQVGNPPSARLVLAVGDGEHSILDRISEDWNSVLHQLEVFTTFRINVLGAIHEHENDPATFVLKIKEAFDRLESTRT
jgi:hypothetical protein